MLFLALVTLIISSSGRFAQTIHESDINFRVDAGSRTCFFERGRVGQMMEAFYQVLDGQHGDLDISFEILDPNGVKLISDHKKTQNSIIMDLAVDGDYVFCLDNTYSLMNSKLVFVNVLIENKETEDAEAEVSVVEDGRETPEPEVLEWTGVDRAGQAYYLEVRAIVESLSRTLRHVLRARALLDRRGAGRTRDSYLALEDTFIVDVWSAFQICFMVLVGMVQVYMIKQLFDKPVQGIIYF